MNVLVTATQQDTIPGTYVFYGPSPFVVEFDFTGTLPAGASIVSATSYVANSNYLTVSATSFSGATVSFSVQANMPDGYVVVLSCLVTNSLGALDGRSVRLVAYDQGTGESTVPSVNVLTGTATITPGAILDGAISAPFNITVVGAASGYSAVVVPSASTPLPNSVVVVGSFVSAPNTVSFQIQNSSGGPVTVGVTSFTATVIA